MGTDPNFPKPWQSTAWTRYDEGTWLPVDENEFHRCPLYVAHHRNFRVSAHKTADGKRWVARGIIVAPGAGASAAVPNGKTFRTRLAAFWNAVDRLQRAERAA